MKKIFDIRHIIIVLLILLAIVEFLNPKGFMPKRTVFVSQTDSIPYPVHDTIPVEFETEVEVPVPYEVKVEVHDTIAMAVDTALILKDFYAKNDIKETLKLPNNLGTIDLKETISQNKVLSRSFDAKVKQKVVKDTIYTPEPRKTRYYLGFDAKLDKPNFVSILGFGFLIKDKNEKIYKIDLGVQNLVAPGTTLGEFTPYIGGGVYWNIHPKK